MENKIPKILVVTIHAWEDNTGINTIINFFRKWDKSKIAQIYARSDNPSTVICDDFFQISENAVVKSVFKRNIKTGKRVYNVFDKDKNNKESKDYIAEQKKYSFFRKHRSGIFDLAREFAWLLGNWKTNELDEYLDNCEADIIFAPIYPYPYMSNLQRYIIKRLNKPVITYIMDDVYFYKQKKGDMLFCVKRFMQRRYVKDIMKYNNKLFVIAPKLKKVFDEEFNIDSSILTKGINHKNILFEEKELNDPIRLVYTGKTYIGRWKSLSMIAKAIEKINSNGQVMELLIYTKDELTDKVSKALNIDGASRVMGGISMDEVMQVQRDADIVVFAECLERKYKDIAWLSFSTKLTDYMSNGKCILAVGADDIAPIEYLRENNCAMTACSEEEIYNILKMISEKPDLIKQYSKSAYDCGLKNHNEELVIDAFHKEIIKIHKEFNLN